MKLIECKKCGSNELFDEGGHVVCAFCRLRYIPQQVDQPSPGTGISISDDIRQLLEKCETDPSNRRRYANLILDLDPSNAEVSQYL